LSLNSNSALEANAALLAGRFPELADMLGLSAPGGAEALLAAAPAEWALEPTPSGLPTLRSGTAYVHSRRDPGRDAERLAADGAISGGEGCVFFCPGLAYAPEALARRSPQARLVIVEPDVYAFATALSSRSLEVLFAHGNLALVVGLSPADTRSVLEKLGALELAQHVPPAVLPEQRAWLAEFRALADRAARKDEINRNTLRRFGGLWLDNMCRNLGEIRDRDGIARFQGLFPDVPALVLAAGPSLDEILPVLPELAERCVVIAVDTALRACLSAGVEPDFTVLVDPQYWNWRHLDGTSATDTVLITESAAWPAVFRYPARDVFLCSSLFPLGKFLEARIGVKGELGAGGSVATTAWDFARHMGCSEIFVAGLDLGFPRRQTHFKGSVFEERTHGGSSRLSPSETAGFRALYAAGPYPVPDYRGSTVLTDKRLNLYAWWFESRIAANPATRTAILTHGGMRIPGIVPETVESLLRRGPTRTYTAQRIGTALARHYPADRETFRRAMGELAEALRDFTDLAERAIRACDRRDNDELTRIDARILAHPAKEIAAMVFGTDGPSAPIGDPFGDSREVYAAVAQAARFNLDRLRNFWADWPQIG